MGRKQEESRFNVFVLSFSSGIHLRLLAMHDGDLTRSESGSPVVTASNQSSFGTEQTGTFPILAHQSSRAESMTILNKIKRTFALLSAPNCPFTSAGDIEPVVHTVHIRLR